MWPGIGKGRVLGQVMELERCRALMMMYCLGYQPRLTMVTLQATTGHLITVGKSPVCDRSIESRMNVVGMGDWQASVVIDCEAVDTGDGELVSGRIERLPLPTTGTLDCVLKVCCPEQLLSRWKVGSSLWAVESERNDWWLPLLS